MNRDDALIIGNYLVNKLKPFCLPEKCVIAGGTRRGKANVHDLEIVCQPDLSLKPRPIFGVKPNQMPAHKLAMELIDLEHQDFLFFKQGQDRNRRYWINLSKFGMPESQVFMLDLFVVLPPAQFGVQLVIRTGPGGDEDNFSKWVVTPRSNGGALPDGYCVRNGAVWREEQIRENGKPMEGQLPLLMPTEEEFLDFLGVTESSDVRHAHWGQFARVK